MSNDIDLNTSNNNLLKIRARVNHLDDINAVRDTMKHLSYYKGVAPDFYSKTFMDKPLEESI